MVQGYFYSQPVSSDLFEKLVSIVMINDLYMNIKEPVFKTGFYSLWVKDLYVPNSMLNNYYGEQG